MEIEDLALLSRDPDWTVRYEVAIRAEDDLLAQLAEDPDPEVSQIARDRLANQPERQASDER